MHIVFMATKTKVGNRMVTCYYHTPTLLDHLQNMSNLITKTFAEIFRDVFPVYVGINNEEDARPPLSGDLD